MTSLTVGRRGEVGLPEELRKRYGIEPGTPVRVIETGSGVLLVPLTDAAPSAGLAGELAEWQSAAADTWNRFPYEEDA